MNSFFFLLVYYIEPYVIIFILLAEFDVRVHKSVNAELMINKVCKHTVSIYKYTRISGYFLCHLVIKCSNNSTFHEIGQRRIILRTCKKYKATI